MPVDDFTVRPAGGHDTDAIARLLEDTFGPDEAALAEPWLTGPDAPSADWSVAVLRGGTVVGTSARLEKWWTIDGAAVPVAQIEFVATRPDQRGQGVVRAQFEHHHRRAGTAGQVLHVVNGIPYFYRRFGYGYGLTYPTLHTVGPARAGGRGTSGIVVREGSNADAAAVAAFEAARSDTGLVRPDPSPTVARRLWLAERSAARTDGRPTERVLVAERGTVVGWVPLQLRPADRRAYLLPGRAADTHAADALLDAAVAVAATEGLPLIAQDTPDDAFGRRLRARSAPLGIEHGIYARAPHPVALLRALGPVLERRLAASPFAGSSGSVTISRFVDGVRIDHHHGRITAIDPAEAIADPYAEGECGVAPDWFAALVLGRWGAAELARRADDVSLGRHADLLAALFPACTPDVAIDL